MRTFKELCADYVLNILEQDERERFEQMLDEATDKQRALYEQMRTKGNELLFSDTDEPSPEKMREKLLAAFEDWEEEADEEDISDPDENPTVEDERKEAVDAASTNISFAIVVAVVLGIICLSLLFYSFSLQSDISNQQDVIDEKDEQITQLEEKIDELNDDLDHVKDMLSIAESRQLQVVTLLGMEASPFGYGNVIWDSQNEKAIVQVGKLPVPSEDKHYQLWAIFDNKAIALTSFSVDEEGMALFMADNLSEIDNRDQFSFAVTLETDDNPSQPNGEMYLMGSFGE